MRSLYRLLTGLHVRTGEHLMASAAGTEDGEALAPELMGEAKGVGHILARGVQGKVDRF